MWRLGKDRPDLSSPRLLLIEPRSGDKAWVRKGTFGALTQILPPAITRCELCKRSSSSARFYRSPKEEMNASSGSRVAGRRPWHLFLADPSSLASFEPASQPTTGPAPFLLVHLIFSSRFALT